jgi:hypothetical protein
MGNGQNHPDQSEPSDYFDPNTSRFMSRSASSASTPYDSSSSPYRSRISRISFSYPRRPTSPSGPNMQPAHPYALYQQTTFEEPEETEEAPAQSIPIGFTAVQSRYRRRAGPDGEELEVIGPDGHTEQLPPYSRYPEAGPIPPKAAMADVSPVNSVNDVGGSPTIAGPAGPPSMIGTPTTAHVSPVIPSAPGTPYISRNNTDDFRSPIQYHLSEQSNLAQVDSPQLQNAPPTQSSASSSDARALQSSASSLAEEKKRGSGGWSSIKRKRVLCGVPVWVVVVIFLLILCLAIIAGGVLGGMLTHARERKQHK